VEKYEWREGIGKAGLMGKNDRLEGQGVILRGSMRLEESAEKAELEQLQ
jgi:hypothetical protein